MSAAVTTCIRGWPRICSGDYQVDGRTAVDNGWRAILVTAEAVLFIQGNAVEVQASALGYFAVSPPPTGSTDDCISAAMDARGYVSPTEVSR